MDMQDLQAYMALMQPGWRVLPEQSLVRSYIEDMSNAAYPLRVALDVDVRLVDTPPALERLMLIRQNHVLRAHIHHLLTKAA